MKATCCFYPLDIFRISVCANGDVLHPDGARIKHSFRKLRGPLSSPHFHLKLSAEAGAMFVSELIVLLASFSS